jgi:hypothetical protein
VQGWSVCDARPTKTRPFDTTGDAQMCDAAGSVSATLAVQRRSPVFATRQCTMPLLSPTSRRPSGVSVAELCTPKLAVPVS